MENLSKSACNHFICVELDLNSFLSRELGWFFQIHNTVRISPNFLLKTVIAKLLFSVPRVIGNFVILIDEDALRVQPFLSFMFQWVKDPR